MDRSIVMIFKPSEYLLYVLSQNDSLVLVFAAAAGNGGAVVLNRKYCVSTTH